MSTENEPVEPQEVPIDADNAEVDETDEAAPQARMVANAMLGGATATSAGTIMNAVIGED